MNLRPYQTKALDGIVDAFKSSRSTLAVLPTGGGKTILFAHAIEAMKGHGRALVLAHREELIDQAADKIHRVTGIKPDIEMGGRWAAESGLLHAPSPIIVSSIQTQIAGMEGAGRMTRFKPEQFGLVVVDEAHHAPAESYRRVIDYYKQGPAKILGVTATPDRADEQALGQIFETVAFEYGILDAINDGWLVPIHQQFIVVDSLDLSQCRTTAGDLNGADLSDAVEDERTLHGMVFPTLDIVKDRKTLVFATSVAQAERIAEIFNRHKPDSARCVFGHTPKEQRRETLRHYSSGMFQTLVNVGVATEGFDQHDIEVVVMGRPTKSRALYAQMVGRGTRPLAGIVDRFGEPDQRRLAIADSDKPHCLVLDFVGNSGRHKLVSTADILGGNYADEVVDRAREQVEKAGGDADMAEALRKAEAVLKEEERRRTEEARKHLKFAPKYSRHSVNPFDLLQITPKREPGWYKGRSPSEKMVAFAERMGIDGADKMTFFEVKQLLDAVCGRLDSGGCTLKQQKCLARASWYEDGITRKEASRRIDVLAKNNWRRPADVPPCAVPA